MNLDSPGSKQVGDQICGPALFEGQLWMIAHRDSPQRGSRLALRSRDQEDGLVQALPEQPAGGLFLLLRVLAQRGIQIRVGCQHVARELRARLFHLRGRQNSVAIGIELAEILRHAWRARLRLGPGLAVDLRLTEYGSIYVGTVHPGKYLVLVGGEVADVEEALDAGREIGAQEGSGVAASAPWGQADVRVTP